ncbi:MAG: glycosyltransferase [Vicingaceae bacterium]
MKLSIIIVNYNVQYFLENCLNSVFQALKSIDAEVFVVDNNSVDGSLKMLETKFPQVKVIANKENQGFSKANNQAIRQANGEFVLLLNPDTVVEENTFKVCLNFFEKHEKAGGIGVKMLDGKGHFLPESKRGLPTPKIAFYKIFGLSSLFPKSKLFGQYHLGHLSKNENHEVEILSGAFMMIRKSVLDTIGLLDESFFMYGEDIDLSYRITQSGYTNHYLADTSIIHYKGESTKKSSINYVFVFYRAMAIFAKKHFSHKNAQLFSRLINLAIYLRAGLAVLTRTVKHFVLPLLDSVLLVCGIYFFKAYYESEIKYTSGGAYPEEVETYGIPIILLIYLISFLLNGAYSIPTKFKSILRGASAGTLAILIFYSLLSENYRFSRAIILFAVSWSLVAIPILRYVLHLIGLRKLEKIKAQRIAIVGKGEELKRIGNFLKSAIIPPEVVLNINSSEDQSRYDVAITGKLYQLQDIVEIYKINEIIFCAKDLSSAEIIHQMSSLKRKDLDFKIAPSESMYIIGSNSIENSGEFYLLEIDSLLKAVNQRNKRLLDLFFSIFFIVASPLLIWFVRQKGGFIQNLFKVLLGQISFVGFYTTERINDSELKIKQGILHPQDAYDSLTMNEETRKQINLTYGRKYELATDLEVIFKNIRNLGRPVI